MQSTRLVTVLCLWQAKWFQDQGNSLASGCNSKGGLGGTATPVPHPCLQLALRANTLPLQGKVAGWPTRLEIVLAAATWNDQWTGLHIKLHCDNLSVVYNYVDKQRLKLFTS